LKTIYSAGEWQKVLVDEIQVPGKEFLDLVATKKFSPRDILKAIRAIKSIMAMPEPTKENTGKPNSHILIDIKEDFFRHINIGRPYLGIFKLLFNYLIIKHDYDEFYESCLNWMLGEIMRRGWRLQDQNRPSSVLWNTIPPNTRKRLEQSIIDNYQILQDRIRVIHEKLGDSAEGKIHKGSRYEQFAKRILTDVEREVIAWR